MLFQSPISMYQVFVRPKVEFFHPVTGVKTSEVRALVANFGDSAGEFSFQNPMDGSTDRGAAIRGHFFDTDAQAERENWSPEEKESVETILLEQCQKTPFWIWKVEHEEAAVSALEKPWTTYDTTKSELIAEYAGELECLAQALAYEAANKNRKGVITALEEKLDDAAQTEQLTAVGGE
jgi:hypothetical protein